MAKQYATIEPPLRDFIERQRIFFVASAAPGARVNVSPRPTDYLRVIDERTACYLDRTGSGNETMAHLRADGRLTFMLCAFEGPPRILRLYGTGRSAARGSREYASLLAEHYAAEPSGARQIVVLAIDLVQTSCGYGVPLFDYEGERDAMDRWTDAKVAAGEIDVYQREKNAQSIDGLPTGMFD